jgi:hypothetical protein
MIGLSWGLPSLHSSHFHVCTEATTTGYYRRFEKLLRRFDDALVIPCTQRGVVLANCFRNRHRILAEPNLTHLRDFDKLRLRERQPSLADLMPPYFSVTDSQIPLPALAKPRFGHSSQGHVLLRIPGDGLPFARTHFAEPLLPDAREEYSLTMIGPRGKRRWSCIRRILQSEGRTIAASRILSREPAAFARKIVDQACVDVILNVQFAWLGDHGIIYDLNPRFGYAELFRLCFGFNFVSEWLGLPCKHLSDADHLEESGAWALTMAESGQVASTSRKTSHH